MDTHRIRFGGRETPGGFLFELSGGHPALDFANTLDERGTSSPRDLLGSYEDLVNWGRQAEVIGSAEARRLVARARRVPRLAAAAFLRAIELRGAIFAVFHAFARGERVPPRELRDVEAVAREAMGMRRLSTRPRRFTSVLPESEMTIVWRVAEEAVRLLTSSELGRVRACDGTGCEWLFVDRSRKGNRRWCDMSVCGNREKARRHYRRRR